MRLIRSLKRINTSSGLEYSEAHFNGLASVGVIVAVVTVAAVAAVVVVVVVGFFITCRRSLNK